LLSEPLKYDILGICWRGFGGVDDVLNAQGLVCGCVNRAWKFTPHARVAYVENKRVKAHMMQVWINNALYKWVRVIGFGKVQLCRLGRITLMVPAVFGMLVPPTPTPCVAHVGDWASKSIGIENGIHISTNPAQIAS
jgi:hypothetical protein